MRLFSLFIFLGISTILIPSDANPLFDILSFSIIFFSITFIIINHSNFRKPKLSKSFLSIFIFSSLILICFCINLFEQGFLRNDTLVLSLDYFKLSILGLSNVIMFFFTFFIISSLRISEKQKINFVFYFVIAGGINAIITTLYWVINTGGIFERYNYIPPISGSNGIHLYYMIFTVLLGLSLRKIRNKLNTIKRGIVNLSILLCFFNMTTVMVREGWVIFILSLLIYWFITSKKSYSLKILTGAFMTSIIVYLIYTVFSRLNLLSDIFSMNPGDTSASSLIRFAMIADSLKVFFSNPYFGVGYGTFSLHVDLFVILTGGTIVPVNSPHNGLILIACELGVFGVLTVFFVCYSILKDLHKNISCNYSSISKSISSVIFPLLLLLSIDQVISNSLFFPPPSERPLVQLAFFIWLLISVALSKTETKDIKSEI